eukprot:TRINITY_DN44_c0_g1_i4.p1 TRINITY_DN44_c0_g1~~TRINITY_DN44_c0_g1_i4.p1  ORF type:complete len:420 (-),score=125.02 TRINITY_DN44_c0_g1_i4:47-1306(-)
MLGKMRSDMTLGGIGKVLVAALIVIVFSYHVLSTLSTLKKDVEILKDDFRQKKLRDEISEAKVHDVESSNAAFQSQLNNLKEETTSKFSPLISKLETLEKATREELNKIKQNSDANLFEENDHKLFTMVSELEQLVKEFEIKISDFVVAQKNQDMFIEKEFEGIHQNILFLHKKATKLEEKIQKDSTHSADSSKDDLTNESEGESMEEQLSHDSEGSGLFGDKDDPSKGFHDYPDVNPQPEVYEGDQPLGEDKQPDTLKSFEDYPDIEKSYKDYPDIFADQNKEISKALDSLKSIDSKLASFEKELEEITKEEEKEEAPSKPLDSKSSSFEKEFEEESYLFGHKEENDLFERKEDKEDEVEEDLAEHKKDKETHNKHESHHSRKDKEKQRERDDDFNWRDDPNERDKRSDKATKKPIKF